MNQVERVKKICKEKKISLHKLEMECGFGNGYISQLRKGVFPADRLIIIANYLGVQIDTIMEDDTDTIMNPTVPQDAYDRWERYLKAPVDIQQAIDLLLGYEKPSV